MKARLRLGCPQTQGEEPRSSRKTKEVMILQDERTKSQQGGDGGGGSQGYRSPSVCLAAQTERLL